MRFTYTIMVCFLLGAIVCGTKIEEESIKNEIMLWWDTKDLISDVIVEDYSQDGSTLSVLGRLVVYGDTTERLAYKFGKFEKGWKISEGPVDPMTKDMLIEQFGYRKIVTLKMNMYTMQLALEDFATRCDGSYPSTLTTKISDIIQNVPKNENNTTVRSLLPESMVNPFLSIEPVVIQAIGSENEWLPEYTGKVVFFPKSVSGKGAQGYLLKGSTNIGFIDFKIECVW